MTASPQQPIAGTNVQDLCIDPSTRSVSRRGVPITLERGEWRLLDTLLKTPGDTVTRAELLEVLLGVSNPQDEPYLLVEIWRLRGQIEIDPSAPMVIKTTAEGYRFDPCGQVPCVCG